MLTLAVATDTSFMICSKRAVSSACRCMCSEIFSLNLRGFAMSAAARARVSAWRADSGWAHTRVYATTTQRGGAGGQLLAGALTAPALAGAKLAHGGGRDA